jgi:hypothetical protein
MRKSSNGDENLQMIYHWKALTEENSLKQLVLKMVCYASLASRKKGIGWKIELVGLGEDEANWRFKEQHVGPTIRLRQLLA